MYNMEELPQESTVSYYINKIGINFDSEKEKDDFIKYCDYMMFSNYEKPYPIPEEDVKDNFRYLYKYVEMIYEEDIMEEHYLQKENDEMKYYEDDYHNDYHYNVKCDEDLYLIYNKLYK
jgi:hypothetical protein